MFDIDREKYLSYLKGLLFAKKNWKKITLSRQWTVNIPTVPGVYVFRESGEIVYVGETGNLRGRMNDLLDSRHHSVRRTIGNKLYSNRKDFTKATTKIKFPASIEILLNKHLTSNLEIAYLPLNLGRKELEELIEKEIGSEIKLNKRGQRKSA